MPESFAGETVYVADGDAGMRALADALHARYEAPGTPGVTCALRRGALGAVMATPEAVVRSAWFPHLRYRTRHVARREVGALVVRAGALAQLTAPQQSRLRQQAATWSAAWLDRSQRRIAADLNAVEPSAADLLARRLKPLSRVDLTSQEEAAWAFVYRQVQDSLVGTLYDAAGLDALRAAVQSPVMVVTDH